MGLWAWIAADTPQRTRGLLVALFGLSAGLAGLSVALEQAAERGDEVRRDGFAAVRVQPRNDAELDAVLAMSADVWSEQLGGRTIDVVLAPAALSRLRSSTIPFEVLVPDIQIAVDAERERIEEASVAKPADWFAEYKDFAAVSEYLDAMVARRPELVTARNWGTSVEGRPIRGVRISGPGEDKIGIALNGGQHAREWISVMVTTCVADRLVKGYDSDPRTRALLDDFEFFVLPVLNPDGYQYSWDVDRYWRKNRGGKHGVDLNRNYAVGWGERGSSNNPRSQIYRGPKAFSEPESQALRSLFETESIAAHIDFHSYSQLILYPWSHTKKASPDRDRHAAIADRMASAIHNAHGKSYKIQSGADLYPAGGTAFDWSHGAHSSVSYVIELRPKGRGGDFVLPPEQIVPTCDESMAAVFELAEAMR